MVSVKQADCNIRTDWAGKIDERLRCADDQPAGMVIHDFPFRCDLAWLGGF